MPLPKIMVPKFTAKLPSSGQEVTFRPFVVKEEKVLLMALQSGEVTTMTAAIKDAIQACVYDVDVSKLPYFDIEYLFLNLRAKSVGEKLNFTYQHRDGVNNKGEECKAKTEVEVNIEDVNVTFPEGHSKKFMLNEQYGVVLKYPTIDSIQQLGNAEASEIAMMALCVDYVFDSTDIYPIESFEDTVSWIENLDAAQFSKLSQFFETMPKLQHSVHYRCKGCGQEEVIKFEGVADFFS